MWAILIKFAGGNKRAVLEMDMLDIVTAIKAHSDEVKLAYELNRESIFETVKWQFSKDAHDEFPTKFHYLPLPWDGDKIEQYERMFEDEENELIDDVLQNAGQILKAKNPNEQS